MQVIINMEFIVVNATSADSSDMADNEGCKSCLHPSNLCEANINQRFVSYWVLRQPFTSQITTQGIYTGVSFQLKQAFSSVSNYQTQSEREVKMCNNCTRQMLIFRPFLYIVTHHVGNQNLKEYRHAYEVGWSIICFLCFLIV